MNPQSSLKKILLLFFFFVNFYLQAVNAQNKAETLHQLNTLLINTVMVDFFTPSVASRIYAYPNIAFYECIRQDDPSLPALSGKLNGLKNITTAPANSKVDYFIAACISFSYVAQNLVGSEYKIMDWRNNFIDSLYLQGDAALIKNSLQYGLSVADSIIAWTRKDNYLKSRGMSRFVISDKPGTWQATPLEYAQALEPNWNTIRPFTLKSPSQFSPKEKLPYSMSKSSMFNKTLMELYTLTNNLDTIQKATSMYLDDNPNVAVNIGHLSYFIHKISPGGHWIMITQQACIKKGESVDRSAFAYALTSIALFDAFISCWDEKYKTNLIRPITVINQFVDKNWSPYIQTPPFPEFTSGHSVVSNAGATILTALFGENFSFTDETEIPFGNTARHFNSFFEAAHQSTMSRVYGGIHYPETARISINQGKNIGKNVLKILYPTALK